MLIDAGGFGDVIRDWRSNKGTRDASYWAGVGVAGVAGVVVVSSSSAAEPALLPMLASVHRTLTRDWASERVDRDRRTNQERGRERLDGSIKSDVMRLLEQGTWWKGGKAKRRQRGTLSPGPGYCSCLLGRPGACRRRQVVMSSDRQGIFEPRPRGAHQLPNTNTTTYHVYPPTLPCASLDGCS
jgi:hypothetical protein